VYAPVAGRSGLIYAARFQIDAIQSLTKPTLVLDSGWADGNTTNGSAPQPLSEGSMDGKPTFGFGHIPAGQHVTFWLSLQINPTTIGRHRQDVWLYDGSWAIVQLDRSITISPEEARRWTSFSEPQLGTCSSFSCFPSSAAASSPRSGRPTCCCWW
jgi:hypothetical protein